MKLKLHGKIMTCDNSTCQHKWPYRGDRTKPGHYVTCPRCRKSVKIKNDEYVEGKK